jgi:hypothetical protein
LASSAAPDKPNTTSPRHETAARKAAPVVDIRIIVLPQPLIGRVLPLRHFYTIA